jgi:hypothetical protein
MYPIRRFCFVKYLCRVKHYAYALIKQRLRALFFYLLFIVF